MTAPSCESEKPFISAPAPAPPAAAAADPATGGLRRPSGHLATVGSNTASISPPSDATSLFPLSSLSVRCPLSLVSPLSLGCLLCYGKGFALNATSPHKSTYIDFFRFPFYPLVGWWIKPYLRLFISGKITEEFG